MYKEFLEESEQCLGTWIWIWIKIKAMMMNGIRNLIVMRNWIKIRIKIWIDFWNLVLFNTNAYFFISDCSLSYIDIILTLFPESCHKYTVLPSTFINTNFSLELYIAVVTAGLKPNNNISHFSTPVFHTPISGGGEAAAILLSGRVLSGLVAVV